MRKSALTLVILAAGAAPAAAAVRPAPPAVATGVASNVGFAQANLTGAINPRGQATVYSFQYGTSTNYSQATPFGAAPAGSRSANVTVTVSALAPLTVYHYRLIAGSSAGTARGADRTFKTGPIPLTLPITANPSTVTFGDPVQVAGVLSGSNGGGRDVILQTNPFPYTAGFTNVGNTELTNPNGTFSFNVLGLGTTSQVRVVSLGKPSVVSAVTYVHVAVRVSALRVRHLKRRRLRFSGFVTPPGVGSAVAIQRFAKRQWVTVARTSTRPGSAGRVRFSKVFRGRRQHGLFRALVQPTDGTHDPGASPTVRL